MESSIKTSEKNSEKILVAKIKVVVKRWHGWSPEGFKIPPEETIYDKPSGSRLILSASKHKMDGVWGEEDQSTETVQRVDFILKEGYRIFISPHPKLKNQVDLAPDSTIEPLKGKVFPLSHDLPLVGVTLKVGESLIIDPFRHDAGVIYEITIIDIYEKGKKPN
ncbi:hypothetical protein A2715_03470 [Candidatus Woesebacteria bacterium RIFCSPHIGHO2_01_FULL_39_32]|uniref:Uncharacterized protein n=1 Tax=Candidatus Woesebacteria bacterium RIFCSPLOWO2_01_FULL_39_25 TaxID=1802521 RepID=A0A1F8BMR5_9BACT|nr:MAG: hypothetical protein A2715_03470 [Candidatus Woesebacteria bacterium RIFCSPHIGHO2_01_FULL_39_32]OGM37120.1 MAG: hypothetical protein A3F01_05410 [Candidatus Woesebacteria bacterium RIFCSPHIGHO2_12_FULL_38_11]OGM64625.1 MAG: hypothetical protein A2893_06385 [Candidatus Woesebacteria bacterium RIFCSPLOWO2_01_FULL_39_25]